MHFQKVSLATQLSNGKVFLKCSLSGDRLQISGQAKLSLPGEIHLE